LAYKSSNPTGLKHHRYGNPYSGTDRPTDNQLREISRLFQKLEAYGVMSDKLKEDDSYKRSFSAASSKIRTLRDYLYAHAKNIPVEGTVYINRCKHRTTGKLINYRTHVFMGAPAGYKCLGMLRQEKEVIE